MLSAKHINWLDFGIFHGSCLFICAFSYDEVIGNFKKKKTTEGWVKAFEDTKSIWDNDNWGYASKRIIDDRKYFILVLKKRFDFKDESHSRLAHEILHIASFHLNDFLDPMAENEAFAYTHTHLMKQCYKILRS